MIRAQCPLKVIPETKHYFRCLNFCFCARQICLWLYQYLVPSTNVHKMSKCGRFPSQNNFMTFVESIFEIILKVLANTLVFIQIQTINTYFIISSVLQQLTLKINVSLFHYFPLKLHWSFNMHNFILRVLSPLQQC